MRARVSCLLLVTGLLGGCASAPGPGERHGSVDVDEACVAWRRQTEYEIQERLDGTPINLRWIGASLGNFTTKERYYLRKIIRHVWALPLDSLEDSNYPQQVEEECRRLYAADGRL